MNILNAKNLPGLLPRTGSLFPEGKRESSDEKYIIGFNSYIRSICHLLPYSGQRKTLCFIILKDGKAHNINGYDYEIAKIYIEPSKRHRGLAFRAAVEVLCKIKGKYILVILDKNTGALKFWKKVAGELGTHLVWMDYLESMTLAHIAGCISFMGTHLFTREQQI